MDVIFRVILMFIFIQFLVVMSIMTVALLLARPEIPFWGHEPGHDGLARCCSFVIHLPGRVLQSLARMIYPAH